ncbi:bifunctional DNA-formamidopyrimidine glycosylase/DNA-(apurinic or apyrimidinic site) lyase [soil metagenome]
MPEIAEVEAFKKYTSLHCMNKTIIDVAAEDRRVIQKIGFPSFKKNPIGEKFTQVQRKGKYLIITVSSGQKLIMHFGLTGYLIFADSDTEIKFSCVEFMFKKDEALHWCNIRKFGKIWLVKSADEIRGIKELGPDPLKLSVSAFLKLMHDSAKKNIKSFLMDQKIIAGIGNEYSDEILYHAGIDPRHTIKDLSSGSIKKIYNAMQKVLKFAIKLRTKRINLVSKERLFSETDNQQFPSSYLQAHRHTDGKCPKNPKHDLKKMTIGGRSAYYCPFDQK